MVNPKKNTENLKKKKEEKFVPLNIKISNNCTVNKREWY